MDLINLFYRKYVKFNNDVCKLTVSEVQNIFNNINYNIKVYKLKFAVKNSNEHVALAVLNDINSSSYEYLIKNEMVKLIVR